MTIKCDEKDVATLFSEILLHEGLCYSKDEAIAIADIILEEMKERTLCLGSPEAVGFLALCLTENLDLTSQKEAKELATKICSWLTKEKELGSVLTFEGHNDEAESRSIDDDDDDDGIALFDGECELCDRYIQLTKHHLIPKSTWPRIETRLMHAAEAIERGESDKAVILLSPGMIHLQNALQQVDKQSIRQILHRTCDICRPCHSALHKAHDNMDLALLYCTVELILQDPQMAKFCKWANKQRTGKYCKGPKMSP